MLKTRIKRCYLCLILLTAGLFSSCSSQQKDGLLTVAHLSQLLEESSGIVAVGNDPSLWMINDSGDKARLFEVDLDGKIIEVINVVNATNNDWEDLATDHVDRIFIGDFGNNDNDRKDLCIYTVSTNHISEGEVYAEKTNFYFEDQEKFPPKKKNRNYDVEAFVYWNNHFYLFSKNRSSKFDGTTKLYRIPATPGDHKAQLIGTYQTCTKKSICQVTGAALSADGKELVLLTHDALYQFINFPEGAFFEGKVNIIELGHKSQKEAVCFHKNKLYLTDEAVGNTGGNLYQFILK